MSKTFNYFLDNDGEKQLVFDTTRENECINFILEHQINNVVVNTLSSYSKRDLNPLMPLKDQLEGLTILTEDVSCAHIDVFKKLKKLSFIDNKQDYIDLSIFEGNLLSLNCNLTERLIGLNTCINLKNLQINGYHSTKKNLEDLPILNSLQKFTIVVSNITDIRGIENIPQLEELTVLLATKLEYIDHLGLLDKLKSVEFEDCKKIKDYSSLGFLSQLRKIILLNCGQVESLSFLNQLDHLEFLNFWGTNIVDGNLSYCKKIKFVNFDDKKNYSHKLAQFEGDNFEVGSIPSR